jgi:AcrR family transcriptional regulator
MNEPAGDPAGDPAREASIDHRTLPRRRGQALDDAILEAAVAELTEAGYERFSMERVAERARTGKASMYRRWPGKLPLVVSVFYHLVPDQVAISDTGSLRGDLCTLFAAAAHTLQGPAGAAIRGLISDVLRDPVLGARFRAATRGTSLQAMREIVGRARGRGELGDAPVTDRQLETGLSVLRLHFLTHGAPATPDAVDELVGEVVDEVVLPLLRAAASGVIL